MRRGKQNKFLLYPNVTYTFNFVTNRVDWFENINYSYIAMWKGLKI